MANVATTYRPVIYRRGLRNYWNEEAEITVEWDKATKVDAPFKLRALLIENGDVLGIKFADIQVTKDLKHEVRIDDVKATQYAEADAALNVAVQTLDRQLSQRWVNVGEIRHGKQSKIMEMRNALNTWVLREVERQMNDQDEEDGF